MFVVNLGSRYDLLCELTHVQNFLVGFRGRVLTQHFNGHRNLHGFFIRSPDTLQAQRDQF